MHSNFNPFYSETASKKTQTRIRPLALQVMASTGEAQLHSDCRSGWLMVESDFSTSLTKPEQLKYALQCMGRNPSNKSVERYWTQCGGSMSFEQFSAVMRRERRASREDLVQAFRKIDTNGDGYISAEELRRMLTKRGEKMSHDEVQAIIDEADQNGDGKLDYAEFCNLLVGTAEECVRTSQQRAGRALEKLERKSLSSQTQRHRSDRPQRRGVFERREKRREEIRMQLYSSEDQLKKESNLLAKRYPKVPENGGNLVHEGSQDEAALSRQRDVSRPARPVPEVERVRSTTSLEGVQSQSHDVTKHEQVLEQVPGELVKPMAHRETPQPTSESDAAGVEGSKSEVKPETSEARKPTAKKQSSSVSTRKVLDDPFDIPAASKLPPLKASLPPLLPPIAGQTSTEPNTPGENLSTQGSANVRQESSQRRKKRGKHEGSQESLREVVRDELDSVPVQDAGEEEPVTLTVNETAETKPERESPLGGEVPLSDTTPGTDANASDPQPPNGGTELPKEDGGKRKASSENELPIQTSPPRTRKEQSTSQTEGEGGRAEGGQTDHLSTQEPPGARGQRAAAPSSVVALPPKKPKNLELWNSITGKGCIYLDVEEGEEVRTMSCHHYRLNLPSPTHIWMEVGVANPDCLATDVLLFVFHTDENEEPTSLITYTQHRNGQRWVCKLDLDAGCYALIPFTSGCHLKPREEEGGDPVSIMREEGGRSVFTDACRQTLTEVFHRMDLDGNGAISRTEFDFFQEKTSGELCDDDTWKIMQENFGMTSDGELTLSGFLDLHAMAVRDEEGGEGEVWEVFTALGYNKQLQLDQACPFELQVFTEDCEGEIEIVDVLPFGPVIDAALCQVVTEKGVCEGVRDGQGELHTHTFSTPHMTTIAVENQGSKKVSVQLDCSRSTNTLVSRESPVHVMAVTPTSTVVGFHLMPDNLSEPYNVHCIASRILC